MLVLLIGDILFSLDMAWGFEQLGHKTTRADPRDVTQCKETGAHQEPDLVITMGSPSYFVRETLAYLHARPYSKAKYIHWDTDGITWKDIEMNHILLMKPDMVFTVCPEMLDLLRIQGIQSHLLPYAYCPQTHHPGAVQPEFFHAISFTGSAYPQIVEVQAEHYRRKSLNVLFKPLLNNGIRIDLYGDDRHGQVLKALYGTDIPVEWIHGQCPYEMTWQIYSGSSINLVTQNHEHTITKRTFEIMGCGGLALSLGNTAIREAFSPGRDLVVSSSPEETLEMVNELMRNPDKCTAIRANALLRMGEHTYRQRAEYIISRIFAG